MPLVLYDVADGVVTITLNNPDRRNAWSVPMEHEYFDALERAGRDEAVRVIVVTGAGRFFCPGMDTVRLADEAAGETVVFAGRRPQHFPLTIPKPMIAAINGACAGIGLLQALLCDVRFVAREGAVSPPPSPGGASQPSTACRGCSHGWSEPSGRPICFCRRGRSTGPSYALGMASRLCDDDSALAAAQAYARDMAINCSPTSMAVIRRQLWSDLDLRYTEANARWLQITRQFNRPENTDFAEGVASFVERRAPNFAALPASWPLPEPLEFAPQQ